MDLEFIEQVEALQVLKRWQQTLPPGLLLMEAYEVPVSGQSLSQQLEAARWSFELKTQAGDPSISLDQWRQVVDDLFLGVHLRTRESLTYGVRLGPLLV